jgi:hypothetical protein
MMSGNAAQVVNGAASASANVRFGNFGVDNNSGSSPAVTFANASVFNGDFYLAEGEVDFANASFNGSAPWPTVYRTEGFFTAPPTVVAGTRINVTYYGADKSTAAEANPAPGLLNDLTVATTNGAENGKGIVKLGNNVTVNGTLTILADQTLYTAGNNLTIAGAAANVAGNLVDNGTLHVFLASPTGTAFTGGGALPSLQVNAGSVGNSISGISRLLSDAFGGDGVWQGGNDDFTTADGNINFQGGAASSLTVSFTVPANPANENNFANLTTAAGATFALGANAVMSGNLTHPAGVIDLGGFTLQHKGTAPALTVGATTTNGLLLFTSAATNLTVSGAGTAVIGANFEYRDVTNNGAPQTFTLLSASTANLEIRGNLTLSDGVTAAPAGDGAIFDIGAGRILLASGANITVSSGSAFVATNGGATGILTLDIDASNGETQTFNVPASASVANLTIQDNVTLAGDITSSTLTATANFTHSGGLFTFGSANFQVGTGGAGTFVRTGGTYAGDGFFIFAGAAGGFGQGTTAMTLNKLRINTHNTDVTGTGTITVNSYLHLNNADFNADQPAGTSHLVIGDGNGTTIEVTGGGTGGNIAGTGTTTFNAPINYLLNGGSAITISNRTWPANTFAANNVTKEGLNNVTLSANNRTINGNLTLNAGVLTVSASSNLNMPTVGSDITRVFAAALSVSGTFTAANVDLFYSGTGNTGVEYSAPTIVNDLSLLTGGTSLTIVSARTVAGTLNMASTLTIGANTVWTSAQTIPSGSTVIVNGGFSSTWNGGLTVNGTYQNDGTTVIPAGQTLAGTGTFTNSSGGTYNLNGNSTINNLTLIAGTTINANADLALTGTVTGGTNLVINFGGADAQAFTIPGNLTLGNITLAKTSDAKVTASGGNIAMAAGAVLTLTRGVLEIPNPNTLTINLTVGGGFITGLGFVRNPAVATDLAHVIGRLGVAIPAGVIGRTEWPVGSEEDYRPASLTFTAGNAVIAPTTIFVEHVDGTPSGTVNLNTLGMNVAPYAWRVLASTSLGFQVFDIEFTGTNLEQQFDSVDDLRILRRFDGDVAVNGWFLQGGTYSNILQINTPAPGDTNVTARAQNSTGGIVSQAAFFTIGVPKEAPTAFSVSGTLTYDNESNTPISGATVTLNPGGATTTTDAAGAWSFANVAIGSYTVSVSHNGVWLGANATDALLVSNHFNGSATLTGLPLVAADVNNSNTVNNTDALLIVRRFAGLDASFAAGDWAFSSANVNVSDADVAGVGLKGIAVGDANRSNIPTLSKEVITLGQTSEETRKVNLKEVIEIPVRVTSDMEVSAVSARFTYPAELATFEGLSSNMAGAVVKNENGQITLAWADFTGGKGSLALKASDVVFTLKFKPTEEFKSGSKFELVLDGSYSEFASKDGTVLVGNLSTASVEGYVPAEFSLKQNYPNPFNPSTTIEYDLPVDANVSLVVFNILGEQVATLFNGVQNAGSYKFNFDASSLSSGMYIYRIHVEAGDQKFTQNLRMMLLK